MAKKKAKKKNPSKSKAQKKARSSQSSAKKKQTSTRKSSAKSSKPKKSKPQKSSKASKKSTTKKTNVSLNEKIVLESSPYSVRQYFTKRYGKYAVKYKKPALLIVRIVAIIVAFFALALLALFLVFGRDLPDVSQLKDLDFAETTIIYDREGNVLYNIFTEENRKYVPLSYIASDVVDATLAVEDKNFYQHWGFDVFGIVRAQLKNLEEDDIAQGASTITQQLAKNIFLSPERTYERKIKELLLSLQIEWLFSKEEILEMYLNKIPYGSNAFGVEAAAKTFYGKTSHDLSLAEASVLASLPKAPSYFSPYGQNRKELMGYCQTEEEAQPASSEEILEDAILAETDEPLEPGVLEPPLEEVVEPEPPKEPLCSGPDDPNYVKGRKDLVLERMIEDGYITRDEYIVAWREGLTMEFIDPVHKIEAPHFVFYVKELLEEKYGKELVESGGLEVVTTLDPRMQSFAEDIIAERSEYNQNRLGANNASIVAIDPKTGHVLAMVGSRDYWDETIDGQVNVATSFRQPGSSFKPLVYAAAIQNGGIGSGTILGDYKTVFERNYVPSNSDNTFKGRMTVRRALAHSRNIPAIKAFYIAGGEEKLLDFLDKLGITRLREFKNEFNATADERGWTFHYGPAVAIGSGELSLLELVGGYAVIANGGMREPINPILEIRNRDGEIIEQFEHHGEQVMDPQAAFIVNSILSDVYARPGGSWRAGLTIADHTLAAKTGTSNKKVGRTNYPNNLLTIGYTPSIAVAAWVGNTDGGRLSYNAWGLTGAAPIMKAFMEKVLEGVPDEPFPEPEGLIWRGSEVFPSFMETKNYDAQFRKATQETEETEEKDEASSVPVDSGFILSGESAEPEAQPEEPTPTEEAPAEVPVPEASAPEPEELPPSPPAEEDGISYGF